MSKHHHSMVSRRYFYILSFVGIIVSIFFLNYGKTYSLIDDPTVHYDLNEGSGCVANDISSTTAHLGTLKPTCPSNSPVWVSGKIGGGLDFDGTNDYVVASSSPDIDAPSHISIAAWIKHPTTTAWRSIVDKRDSANDGYDLYINTSSKILMRINESTFASTQSVADNGWHHVVGVYDGSKITLYIDGVSAGFNTIGAKTLSTIGQLKIGDNYAGGNSLFDGVMDEVRIYNRALSSSDVADLYSYAGPVDTTGPVISSIATTSNATSFTVSWTTNEQASTQLEFGTTTSYGSTTTEIDTAPRVTSHSQVVYGLSSCTDYNARIITTDSSLNTSTSSNILVKTTCDTTAPVRSGGSPTGVLTSGTTQTILSLTTNEVAVCRYATTSATAYVSMLGTFSTTSSTTHSTLIQNLNDGETHTYYVRCEDTSLNSNSDDYSISFSISSSTNDITAGLVSYFTFDDGSGCNARNDGSKDKGHFYPGCAADHPQWTGSGKVGGAIDNDGINDGIVSSTTDLTNLLISPTSLTISAWIKHPATSQWRSIIDRRDGASDGYDLFINTSSKLLMRINSSTLTSSTTVADNTWHHVAGVYDGSKITLYVDGVQDAQSTIGFQAISSLANLMIGHSYIAGQNSFDGLLDEVRVYNRTLSSTEISSLFAFTGTDTLAPVIYDVAPQEYIPLGSTTTVISLKTQEVAECRMATSSIPFSSMSYVLQSGVGSTTHSLTVSGLEDDTQYSFFIKCKDDVGNITITDATANFSVQFHPSQLALVKFFVESIKGMSVANCSTAACLSAGENTKLDTHYCNTATFSDGCVRRWEDQSSYTPTLGFEPPEWIHGRDFGQDDKEKPGYISNCINGHPCARGGDDISQDLSFEIEPGQHVASTTGSFSVFILAKPINQASNFSYFGLSDSNLVHNLSDNHLSFVLGTTTHSLTTANAVTLNDWHLIEIHRDASNVITAFVDGTNVTNGTIVNSAPFSFKFLLSVSRVNAMYGDVAGALVVADELGSTTKSMIRNYFDTVYQYSSN